MRFKMTVKGAAKKYAKVLKARYSYVQNQVINSVLDRLKINTPIRTGYLVSHYYIIYSSGSRGIINQTPYLWYVNNGTTKQYGQHFIQKSIQQVLININKITKKSNSITFQQSY